MSEPQSATPRPESPSRAITAAVLIACATALFWTWLGLRIDYPYIFADETVFMTHARACHGPDGSLSAALGSPSPVHSAIYSTVFDSGRHFIVHTRFLNALFCGLSVIPAFLLARRFTSQGPALLFAALVGFNPWNAYSANFMPESLYACVLWSLAWAVAATSRETKRSAWRRMLAAAGIGILATILFLTKSHALTLILVCALMFLFRTVRAWRAGAPSWWFGALESVLFLGTTLGCLAIMAAICERSLVDLFFAGRYQNEAGGLLRVEQTIPMMRCFAQQFAGTLAHAGVLYAVPIATACLALRRIWRKADASAEALADLTCFSTLAVSLTLIFSVKFISDLVLRGHTGMADRLIERYYGHLLPLLILVFFALGTELRRPAARVAAMLVGLFSAVTLFGYAKNFTLLAYDAPGFYWLNPIAHEPRALPAWVLGVVLTLAAAHLALFAARRRYPWATFLVVAVPVYAAAVFGAHQQMRRESEGLATLHEYSAMTGHLIESDWSHTVVIGDAFRTSAYQFMLHGSPRVLVVASGATLAPHSIPADTRWLIRLNTAEPVGGPATTTVFRGWAHGTFEIARVAPAAAP